ncbi:MAG: hypothetical protein EBY74_07860, partial [Actinobacteria bacterium]|nr:hypothetical protein [Actinomycetota bacterium]
MSDTMMSMDNYRYIDNLRPDQVMVGDIIEFSDESITEIGIVSDIEELYVDREFSYLIHGRNEFNETLEMIVEDWQVV